jgi:hypothetical protein
MKESKHALQEFIIQNGNRIGRRSRPVLGREPASITYFLKSKFSEIFGRCCRESIRPGKLLPKQLLRRDDLLTNLQNL